MHPAGVLSRVVQVFQAEVRTRNLSTTRIWVDASSVMSVLSLNAEQGHMLEIELSGPDEAQAAQALFVTIAFDLEKPHTGQHTSRLRAFPPGLSLGWKGFPAASGLARGPLRVWHVEPFDPAQESNFANLGLQGKELQHAVAEAEREIRALRNAAAARAGQETAAIFDAHLALLHDPNLPCLVEKWITSGLSAEVVWLMGCDGDENQATGLPETTLSPRAADIRDVATRVVRHLRGLSGTDQLNLPSPAVIAVGDLFPSQVLSVPAEKVLAFCLAESGPTSHAVILARALGLPVVLGMGQPLLSLPEGTQTLVDGFSGQVVFEPEAGLLESFEQRRSIWQAQDRKLQVEMAQPAVPASSGEVAVSANIASLEDARRAQEMGAYGVGLLRTEFFFLYHTTPPSEDEQAQVYADIFSQMGNKPVVVRTPDLGGDKLPPYMLPAHEINPNLGKRGIRLSLESPELFTTQLRALLRASAGRDLQIMFPMIATLGELRQAKAHLEAARRMLLEHGQPIAESVHVGMMVEVPAAVWMADKFAREVDFFSIGTNDLIQYTFAVDRGIISSDVGMPLDEPGPLHPVILRQVRQVMRAARRTRIPVSVCGDAAADEQAIPLLLGLGVQGLSMVPAAIPRVKNLIHSIDLPRARRLAEKACALDTAERVRALLASYRFHGFG